MSAFHWMAMVIGVCGLVAVLLLLAWALQEVKRDIANLHREVGQKHSTNMADLERTYRRALERKVEAIERHLNITIEEEPAKLVVKEKP